MISRFLQRYFNLSNIQKKRLTLNLTSQSVSLFIRIIVQFLFPPLMIFAWGLENFGIWLFLLSLPNLLNIVNFNFIESSKQDMVYFYNQENSEKVKTIFQCSYFLTLFTIAFFLIISLIFYFSSDFNFKATANLSLDVFKMSFIIIVATICLNILDGIFISVVSIKGKAYLIDYSRIVFDTILKISLIVSGLFFNNFFVMVLIFFALKIIETISFYFFYTRHKEYLEISFNKISKKELYRQLKLSVSYNIEIITEIINNNGLIFVLGIFFNASIIALVSTCKTLFYFFPRQIFAAINHASLFEYTSLFAKKEIKPSSVFPEYSRIGFDDKYYSCLQIDFKYRTVPHSVKSGQSTHYAHMGKVDVYFKAYAMTGKEIEKIEKEEVFEDMSLVDELTDISLKDLQEDIDKYFGETNEPETEIKEKKSSNPLKGILNFMRIKPTKLFRRNATKYEIEKVENAAKNSSKQNCLIIYDVFKKAHRMMTW